jgi:hypothetical protein
MQHQLFAAAPYEGCLAMDSTGTLGLCNRTICPCITCNITSYYSDANYDCILCNATIDNCTTCSYNVPTAYLTCTACNISLFLNSTNQCQYCSTIYLGCYDCILGTPHCLRCHWGYTMVANYTCQRCHVTLTTLCWGCYNTSQCYLCVPGFGFISPNVCVPCNNTLPNCSHCWTTTRCYKCLDIFNVVMVNRSRCGDCSEAITNCVNCTSN